MAVRHRGLAPQDDLFFDPARLSRMREGVCDLLWLLKRRYSPKASLELVGNRYQLNARERLAVSRAAVLSENRRPPLPLSALEGRSVVIDGFNLLITVEVALSGGVVLECQDGLLRDIANIHGSYHTRIETDDAIGLLCETLFRSDLARALFLFDRPVSNSGRIVEKINRFCRERNYPILAKTADGVDRTLMNAKEIVLTNDSMILESGVRWSDLLTPLIRRDIPAAKIVDLRCG